MIRRFLFVTAILALLFPSLKADAAITAYDNAAVAPNQFYGNSLGLDFDVNSSINVTSLGAFFGDDVGNLDGFSFGSPTGTGVDVGIYDRNTQALVGSLVHFDSASYGSILNGNAFKTLATPILLVAGQYSVVAFNDPNYNTHGGFNGTSITNDGGGLITFVGGGRFGGTAGIYPTTIDGGPVNRYDAGTFQYTAAVPEPATLTIWGLGALGLAFVSYRRRMLVARRALA